MPIPRVMLHQFPSSKNDLPQKSPLVGGLEHEFDFSIFGMSSSWRTQIFQRGRNQPPARLWLTIINHILTIINHILTIEITWSFPWSTWSTLWPGRKASAFTTASRPPAAARPFARCRRTAAVRLRRGGVRPALRWWCRCHGRWGWWDTGMIPMFHGMFMLVLMDTRIWLVTLCIYIYVHYTYIYIYTHRDIDS